MPRMLHSVCVGAWLAIALSVPAASSAQSRIPAHVRVVSQSEKVMRWLGPVTDVILVVDQGTTLEVLDFDRDKGWYWVILPPDLHGSRKAGWIRGSAVEPADPAPSAQPSSTAAFPTEAQRAEAQAPAPTPAPTAMAPAADDNRVRITVRRDEPSASAPETAAAKKSYVFEEVHFERDAFAVRSEDADRLRVAAAALKDDPSLVVTIEGYTCSLGTAGYNLALGNRRANAVKDYLVSAGAPADRLVTVSRGEAGPEYDNSREETRRLNRRVALVPGAIR